MTGGAPGIPSGSPLGLVVDAATQAVRALHVGEDLRRLRQLAQRVLLPERVRIPRGSPPPPSPAIELALRQPERLLDVALGAALIAAEDQPELEPARAVDRVEEWAARLRARLASAPRDAESRLKALNGLFFDELGMAASSGRAASRFDEDRLADLLLPHVLRRRRGHCLGLSTVYLALAHRARLPVFGVSAPGHFFVRWDGDGLRRNVELTNQGAGHDDEHYVRRFEISQGLVDRGVYLQSLRRREVLVEVLNNRANVYWDRGDEARVLRDLDRVVRLSHNFAQAYLGRGFVAAQRGLLRQAEEDLRHALEIDPDGGRAWLLLGQVLLRKGELGEAETALARATELDGKSALAATYLGRLYGRRGQHDRALQWHEDALRIDRNCLAASVHLAQTRQALGDIDGARRAYHEALRVDPESLRAREGLVLLARGADERLPWTARGAFRAVCRDYERRLRQSPDADATRASYLRFLLEAGLEQERALALGRELVERAASVHNLELFARVLERAGRRSEARASLERAIELDRDAGGRAEGRLRAQLRRVELI
ncbi:MAG: transglutaminase family protein [Planctomycetota bacterium]